MLEEEVTSGGAASRPILYVGPRRLVTGWECRGDGLPDEGACPCEIEEVVAEGLGESLEVGGPREV